MFQLAPGWWRMLTDTGKHFDFYTTEDAADVRIHDFNGMDADPGASIFDLR